MAELRQRIQKIYDLVKTFTETKISDQILDVSSGVDTFFFSLETNTDYGHIYVTTPQKRKMFGIIPLPAYREVAQFGAYSNSLLLICVIEEYAPQFIECARQIEQELKECVVVQVYKKKLPFWFSFNNNAKIVGPSEYKEKPVKNGLNGS